jgi:hypothetical protein
VTKREKEREREKERKKEREAKHEITPSFDLTADKHVASRGRRKK